MVTYRQLQEEINEATARLGIDAKVNVFGDVAVELENVLLIIHGLLRAELARKEGREDGGA